MMYSQLTKVTLIIALDNGVINRHRSTTQQYIEVQDFLLKQNPDEMDRYELWLADFNQAALEIIAVGGQDEPETINILKDVPEGFGEFLNKYFEEVC